MSNKFIQLRLFILIVLILIVISNIQAQDNRFIYFQLGGEAGIYSINYDLRFKPRASGGGGAGFRLGTAFYEDIFIAPLQLNYLFGKNGKYLELAGGATLWSGVTDFGNGTTGFETIPCFSLKYRSQPSDGGFSWSIGATSFTAILPVWAGVSLGHSF